jgi:hypothetical protein
MAYKPSDFFVSIMDFFSVLLPGALLSFLSLNFAHEYIFGKLIPGLNDAVERWAAFVFASYLLGQYIFLVSAAFMDRLYKHTYLRWKKVRGNKDRRNDALFEKAKEMQGQYIDLIGPLKWALTFVRLRSPVLGDALDRFEATQKFFRSLTVVFVIFMIVFLSHSHWLAALVCGVLVLVSFWRFGDQRWKLGELAFLCYIQMNMTASDNTLR